MHILFCKNEVQYIEKYIEVTADAEEKTEETKVEETVETATEEAKAAGVKTTGAKVGYYHPETVPAEGKAFDVAHGYTDISEQNFANKQSTYVNDAENGDTSFQSQNTADYSGIEASNDGAQKQEEKGHEEGTPKVDLNKESASASTTPQQEAPQEKKPEAANGDRLEEMLKETTEKTSKKAEGNVTTEQLEVKEEKASETPKVEAQAQAEEKAPAKTLSAHQLGNAVVGGQLQIKIDSNSHKDVTVNGKKVSGSIFTDECGDEATVKTYFISDGENTVVVNVVVNAIL